MPPFIVYYISTLYIFIPKGNPVGVFWARKRVKKNTRGALGLGLIFEAAVMMMAVLPGPLVIPLYLRQGDEADRDSIVNTLSFGAVATLIGIVIVAHGLLESVLFNENLIWGCWLNFCLDDYNFNMQLNKVFSVYKINSIFSINRGN